MANIIVGGILLLIFGLSIAKIVSEKRKGVKCIGCPHAGHKNQGNVTSITLN